MTTQATKQKPAAQIGTLSSGTMRTADLLESISDEYERLLGGDAASDELLMAVQDMIAPLGYDGDHELPDQASDLLFDLFDAMEQFSPPYCYFGAHEGDGSDYGFWPSHDAIDEVIYDGDMLKVSYLSAIPADYRGEVCIVNDHGNMTIGYVNDDSEFVEAWSIV